MRGIDAHGERPIARSGAVCAPAPVERAGMRRIDDVFCIVTDVYFRREIG
ncbi:MULTISPECIES: hypothetical protein [Burkholderia]|nr:MULTISPECIES: hypothetical protein [Burkholderia]EKS9796687.1 hypothetical protein [Burkholderia cepacia]EKS9800922.1 hypothetical protein [Burkholderia cepacia]EKS9802448.1 hypothetical protein [Burkholderia cepacia]EKS9809762.1 hypothetical protein [Burkholderia cepacia]EKS9818481.1 hypothetical protein [Burkholderia cepacia]